jgi:Fic family protein
LKAHSRRSPIYYYSRARKRLTISGHTADRYYELLDRVRTARDRETWLELFLNGVKESSTQAAQSARQILTLLEGDRQKEE